MRPNKVNILGIDYLIIYVDKPSEVDVFKRESYWGMIDSWTRTIRIYDDGKLQDDVIWQVIFHEVIHGIVDLLHLDKLQGKENEDTVDLLALAIADVLFRNEWMIK